MPDPVGAVIVIVPVATVQVGCAVTDAVGAAGTLIVIVVFTGVEVIPFPSVTVSA